MKKFWILMLCLVLAMGLLAGCGDRDETSDMPPLWPGEKIDGEHLEWADQVIEAEEAYQFKVAQGDVFITRAVLVKDDRVYRLKEDEFLELTEEYGPLSRIGALYEDVSGLRIVPDFDEIFAPTGDYKYSTLACVQGETDYEAVFGLMEGDTTGAFLEME